MNLFLRLLIFSVFIASCKNDSIEIPVTSFEVETELKKWDSVYNKFQNFESELYEVSNSQPSIVLAKIDSLLLEYKNDYNIIFDLHYFKAEVFYNLGEYNKSINELKFIENRETHYAEICNYIKLGEFENAKSILDSISKKDVGFDDFIYANYFEVINNKTQALESYRKIQKDKSSQRFFFYNLAIQRINELNKKESKLLEDIYFPTGNPSFKENINREGI